ncbi:MAG: histidine triad nucleotide-binding protein [Anaerolineae bacterium]|nr:histidine triad nucleotide-binding protein [Anaerolineae bacterium]
MENCIFCSIISEKIPAQIVYTDEQVVAFKDIHPAAPVHILVIPRRHIESVNVVQAQDETLLGHMVNVAGIIARQQGLEHKGYRLVINTGPDSGQTVFHIHLHILGGRKMPFRFDEE